MTLCVGVGASTPDCTRLHLAATSQSDCGMLGIVLFKLEWDGRYRTVLATVKTGFHEMTT